MLLDSETSTGRGPVESAPQVYERDGVYIARLQHSGFNEPVEIVLHGAVSIEQAQEAARALKRWMPGDHSG